MTYYAKAVKGMSKTKGLNGLKNELAVKINPYGSKVEITLKGKVARTNAVTVDEFLQPMWVLRDYACTMELFSVIYGDTLLDIKWSRPVYEILHSQHGLGSIYSSILDCCATDEQDFDTTLFNLNASINDVMDPESSIDRELLMLENETIHEYRKRFMAFSKNVLDQYIVDE